MEQVAVLEYQQQEELEELIYRAAFLLADVGFFQEPAYTKLPDGISKPALNFGVVISVSMVYHKIGTFLRYFLISLILLYQRTGAFCCQCTNIFASKARNLKVFSWVGAISDVKWHFCRFSLEKAQL